MPRHATGEIRERGGILEARITLKGRHREEFKLPTCKTLDEAKARSKALATMARRFRRAGLLDTTDARRLLDMAAAAPARTLEGVLKVADELIGDELMDAGAPDVPTFEELAKRWTHGELHKLYPDHVKNKDASLDKARIAKLCDIDIGGVKLGELRLDIMTLDHADAVMRNLPKEARRPATRRAYAQLVHRVMSLAVYPCRHIERSPIPRGWLPKAGRPPAYPYLYAEEDARLMRSNDVPLVWRLLFGFLAREGCRRSEAAAFTWNDFDLERGAVSLGENKTDDPRAWALDPGVAQAMRIWREHFRKDVPDTSCVFSDESGAPIDVEHLAHKLRTALGAAGVDRSELFDATANRGRLRAHDLRATFITLSLANGRTETWVQDRTGHTTSDMINRYRRQARQAQEIGMQWLGALNELIPEFADCPRIAPNALSLNSDARPDSVVNSTDSPEKCTRRDLNPHALRRRNLKASPYSTDSVTSRDDDKPIDEQGRAEEAVGATGGNAEPPVDVVEAALADALMRAATAGQWSTVEVLSRELTARREARAAVVDLAATRAKRAGG